MILCDNNKKKNTSIKKPMVWKLSNLSQTIQIDQLDIHHISLVAMLIVYI